MNKFTFTTKETELINILLEETSVKQNNLPEKLLVSTQRVHQLISSINDRAKEIDYITEDIIIKNKFGNTNIVFLDIDALASIYVEDILVFLSNYSRKPNKTIEDISNEIDISSILLKHILESLEDEDRFIYSDSRKHINYALTISGDKAVRRIKKGQ